MLRAAALIANQFKLDPRVVAAATTVDRVILAAAYRVARRSDVDDWRSRGGV